MTFLEHVDRWKDCERCPLAVNRRRVVHYRGQLPCDVLFLGEAPGVSEVALGRPFVGPAGKLLDDQIEAAGGRGLVLGFCNVVGCIPLEPGTTTKTKKPPETSIEACRPRLTELFTMARPKLVVTVGPVAQTELSKRGRQLTGNARSIHVVHPYYILQAHQSNQGLLCQEVVRRLREAFGEVARAVGS